MNEEAGEEKGLGLAKLIGFLFIIVGLGLIFIAALQFVEIPSLSAPEIEQLKNYLSGAGTINLVLYGILSFALGIGLMKEEEWAAGGSFVLLLIIITYLSTYIYYWTSSYGFSNMPFTITASIITVVISVFILIYLIWARGWK